MAIYLTPSVELPEAGFTRAQLHAWAQGLRATSAFVDDDTIKVGTGGRIQVNRVAMSQVSGLTAALNLLQPKNDTLAALAALETTPFGRALLETSDSGAAQAHLGLQPLNETLQQLAGLSTTPFGRSLLELSEAAAPIADPASSAEADLHTTVLDILQALRGLTLVSTSAP